MNLDEDLLSFIWTLFKEYVQKKEREILTLKEKLNESYQMINELRGE